MKKSEFNKIVKSIEGILEIESMSGIDEINIKMEDASGKTKIPKPDLEALKKLVLACERCPLSTTRKNVVFGEGSKTAKLMFIGEAPGADEDEQGRPFVGKAGKLLTKIIEAMGLKREEVFIANILKCRPPGNRNPLPSEIAVCSSYLKKQIEMIKPEVICALGKFAAQTLLNSEVPISRMRGNFYEYNGIKLMPTYHPAYLLRNPSGKKDVWEDMKKIAKEIGIKIPSKK